MIHASNIMRFFYRQIFVCYYFFVLFILSTHNSFKIYIFVNSPYLNPPKKKAENSNLGSKTSNKTNTTPPPNNLSDVKSPRKDTQNSDQTVRTNSINIERVSMVRPKTDLGNPFNSQYSVRRSPSLSNLDCKVFRMVHVDQVRESLDVRTILTRLFQSQYKVFEQFKKMHAQMKTHEFAV